MNVTSGTSFKKATGEQFFGGSRVICTSSGKPRPAPDKCASPYESNLQGRGDTLLLKGGGLMHVQRALHVHRPSLIGTTSASKAMKVYGPLTSANVEGLIKEMYMTNIADRKNNFLRVPHLGMTTQHFFSPPGTRLEGELFPKEAQDLQPFRNLKPYVKGTEDCYYSKKHMPQIKPKHKLMYATQRVFAIPPIEVARPKPGLANIITLCKKNGKPQTRPNTGKLKDGDKAEPQEAKKTPSAYYPGTAYRLKRDTRMKDVAQSMPLVKPQTVPEHRPDSRYNRATLCASLENGRSQSPDYKVPIFPMKLQEANHVLLPSCWT